MQEALHQASAESPTLVKSLERPKPRTMTAEEELETTTGLYQSSGQVDQFLHHGLDPAPLGGMAHRALAVHQCELPHGAQDVVRQPRKGQDQGVGGEFARRKPLCVHVRFDLTVELLTRPMILVEPDHLLFGQIERGPPPVHFDLRHQENLAVTIDRTLHCSHHPLEPVGLPRMDLLNPDGEQADSFSRARRADFPLLENSPGPFFQVLFAGVPLENVADLF